MTIHVTGDQAIINRLRRQWPNRIKTISAGAANAAATATRKAMTQRIRAYGFPAKVELRKASGREKITTRNLIRLTRAGRALSYAELAVESGAVILESIPKAWGTRPTSNPYTRRVVLHLPTGDKIAPGFLNPRASDRDPNAIRKRRDGQIYLTSVPVRLWTVSVFDAQSRAVAATELRQQIITRLRALFANRYHGVETPRPDTE
jgi:hypothetical protein